MLYISPGSNSKKSDYVDMDVDMHDDVDVNIVDVRSFFRSFL